MSGQFEGPSSNVLGPKHGVQVQHVSISSKDRIAGYPGQFVVNLLPNAMNHIMKIELLEFTGQLHPYNVLNNATYRIVQSIPSGPTVTVTTYNMTITPGDYSLDDLLVGLNLNPFMRFSYNDNTGKVIAERLSGVIGTLTASDLGSPAIIGSLIGYPQGVTLDPSTTAVQSVFAVSPHQTVSSIIIGFDEFAPGVVTTGNISSGFTIPVNGFTYDRQTRQIKFARSSDFEQAIDMNRKTVSRLYVKIQNQTVPGTAFRYVGECYMDLNIYYVGGSGQ